jgi:four helix bundle protein
MSTTYKDLLVWQKAIELTKDVYRFTSDFPKKETYSLADQMQRAAVSIASNIAEGQGRRYNQEFSRFLQISYGSLCELETQMIIADELGYVSDKESVQKIQADISEIGKMLNGLIANLKFRSKN